MSDLELARENRDVYEWIRDNGHSDFVRLAEECDAFTRGEQWDPRVKARLALRRKPHLTINKVLATAATLFGEHLIRRGDISFRASVGGLPTTAAAIDKLWINFTNAQNFEWKEFAAFVDGVIRGRGFLDLRVDFDENMRGEPAITYLNSKDVGLYPGDAGFDPDDWTGVMLTKWLSPRDISQIYGAPINDVMVFADDPMVGADYTDWMKDSFGSTQYDNQIISNDQRAKYRLLRVLERQEWEYKTVVCFVSPETGEVREIPSTWDRERIFTAQAQYGYNIINRRVKKIKWVVSVGDLLLHSAISPYKHFTPIGYFPFIIGGKPIGIIEHLRDPQNLLNKTLSQELHIVAGIANSGFKVKQGSLSNMTTDQLQERGGEDGIVIEVSGALSDVEKLQPNQVPTGLDRLSYKASEAMQEISLVNDSMQGLNRADEAGKAIERKAIQGATSLSPIYASLDQMRRIVGRNWLDLTQEFVTEERMYYITGNAKTAQPQPLEVNKEQDDGTFLNDLTVGEYAVSVTDISARDSWNQYQYDILMQAMRQGAPIPWSEVINTLTILENKDEIVKYLQNQEGQSDPTEEQQKQQQLQMRIMEAEAADKEATANVKNAQAQKAQASAAKEAQPDNSAQMEMAKAQHDAQIKQQDAMLKAEQMLQKAQLDAKMASEQLEFQRQKFQLELEFMREKQALELEKIRASIAGSTAQTALKLDSAQQQAEIQSDMADQKMRLQAQKHTEQMKQQKRKSNSE